MTEPNKKPLLSPTLQLFLFTMILANISGVMSDILMPLYVQSLGASVTQVGLFFTLGAIAPLAFQILGGWLSDSVGRLQAVAIGSIAGIIEMIVAVIAPTWEWLFISVIGAAVTRAFVGPSFRAFIAEETDEENLGRAYAISDSLYLVVGIIGPLLGGYLVQGRGFRQMFVVAAAIYALAAAIRIWMARRASRQETKPRERPSLGGLKSSLTEMTALLIAGGLVTWIFISDGILDISFRLSEQLMPLYQANIIGLSYVQIGWLVSIQSFTSMLILNPAGWLSDKVGEREAIVLGGAFVAMGYVVFLSSQQFTGFVLAWALFGVGWALFQPAYSALISKAVPERLRGTAFGLFSTSLGIISLPVPYIGTQIWRWLGPRAPFFVPLVGLLLLLPIVWTKFWLEPKATVDPPAGSI